jgi:pyrroline-5-carboxylate reductase
MIGFIGGGNMAGALIEGLALKGRRDIMVSEPRAERREELEQKYGVKTTDDGRAVAAECNPIVLAVKPQQMAEVLEALAPAIGEDRTVVSVAAGITLKFYEDRLKTKKIVRVMPNVAALKLEGMHVLSLCECMQDSDVASVRDIFMASGRVLTLPEKYMDAVTALSGSGPAFIALFVGAMIEAGRSLGLGETEAMELGTQTLVGTAKLLDGELTPDALIRLVKSPGGTTAAGLEVFESKGLKDMVKEALEAAAGRSKELAK